MAINAGEVTIGVKPDVSGFGRLLSAKLRPVAHAVATDFEKVFGDSFRAKHFTADADGATKALANFRTQLKKAKPDVSGLGKVLGLLKFPVVIALINALIGGISALAAGAVSLIGPVAQAASSVVAFAAGLAPLSGLLTAYPGILLAVGQGFGVLALSLGRVKTALNLAHQGGAAYTSALKNLTPAQQALVKALKPSQEQFLKLQNVATKAIAPGLISSVKLLGKTLFPVLHDIVQATATELGKLAVTFSKMFSSTAWTHAIGSIGKNNVQILHNLGQVALNLSGFFLDLIRTSQPLVKWVSRVAVTISTAINQWSDATRRSGGFRAFFDLARRTAEVVGPALIDVGHILFDIFKSAQPVGSAMVRTVAALVGSLRDIVHAAADSGKLADFFSRAKDALHLIYTPLKNISIVIFEIIKQGSGLGTSLFRSFGDVTKGWVTFVRSVQGRNVIKKFFDDARPVLHEMALLIGGLFRAFGGLARSQGVATLIKSLREGILPVLVSIGNTVSTNLIEGLTRLAVNVGRLFAVFGTETGPLRGFVGTMATLAGWIATLIEHSGPFKGFITDVVALAAIGKTLGVGQIIKATGALLQYLAIRQLVNAQEAAGIGLSRTHALANAFATVKTLAFAAASKIAAAAQWLWNAAMDANPIVLIAIAVGVAAVLIIKNWSKVKDFFIATFNWIKDHWKTILIILTGPIGAAVVLIVNHWKTIRTTVATVFNWIKSHWKLLLGILFAPFTGAIALIVPFAQKIIDAAKRVINWLQDRWQNITNIMKRPFELLLKPIKAVIDTVIQWIRNIISWAQTAWSWVKRLNPLAGTGLVGGALASAPPSGASGPKGGHGGHHGDGMAEGGIVTRPWRGWIGEAGNDEAVMPLPKDWRKRFLRDDNGEKIAMLTITNWKEGTGYIKILAREEIDQNDRFHDRRDRVRT